MKAGAYCSTEAVQPEGSLPGPGIHLKVEQDLQIIQDGVFDIVRFINDDHRSFPFIQRKTVDLLLDDMKVFCFAVGSLRTKRHGKIL